LSACGGGGDVGGATGTTAPPIASGLTLRLTDAKVNNLEAVSNIASTYSGETGTVPSNKVTIISP